MHNNNDNIEHDMMAGDAANRNFNFNLFELANLSITSSLQHSAAGLSNLISRPSTHQDSDSEFLLSKDNKSDEALKRVYSKLATSAESKHNELYKNQFRTNNVSSNSNNKQQFLSNNKSTNSLLLFDKSATRGDLLVDIGFEFETGKRDYKQDEEADNDDEPMINLVNPNFEPDEAGGHELAARALQTINVVSNSAVSVNMRRPVKEDHCHVQKSDTKRNATVWRKLITVLVLCILFMIAEIVGGVLAGSISIMTDAAHMAADIAGFFFSIVAIYVSDKAPTRRMSFGFYRSEILGALLSTIVIWILTGVLVYLAVLRCIDPNSIDIDAKFMVATASCGVVFNIIMYFVLHTNRCFRGVELKHHGHSHSGDNHGHSHSGDNHGHSHSGDNHGHSHSGDNHGHSHSTNNHGHSHAEAINSIEPCNEPVVVDVEPKKVDDSSNINIRAATIHVIGDFIQSVGVLIAALIIYFKPEYRIADPICTFVFSVLVIATTAPIMKDIYFVLMEALPLHLNYDAVMIDLCLIDNVKKAHSLHIWCLTMEKFALSVHLVTDEDVNNQAILNEANSLLRQKYKIEQTTIQIEQYDEIMESCNDCKLPI